MTLPVPAPRYLRIWEGSRYFLNTDWELKVKRRRRVRKQHRA